MERLFIDNGQISFVACQTHVNFVVLKIETNFRHGFSFRIRAALKLTLPSRHDLINKLISKCSPEEIDIFAEEIIQACNTIEKTTEELFEAQGMTKLP